MEKADILEMTVHFLTQKQLFRHGNSSAANQGHSRCVQETDHLLSKDEVKTQSNRRLLDHFQNLQSSSDTRLSETKEKSSVNSVPWRPWVTTFPDPHRVSLHHPPVLHLVP
ncbi:hypothetical protein N1851_000338 [Merluccius polli]|uniref:BHLH domain-containing protein n=1 Tax=Merluccius polli TaxID=89951 RepID=A0AA47PD75_MERPO|nr:hypothetical protein N1851_000338 [Merluccius polli]